MNSNPLVYYRAFNPRKTDELNLPNIVVADKINNLYMIGVLREPVNFI